MINGRKAGGVVLSVVVAAVLALVPFAAVHASQRTQKVTDDKGNVSLVRGLAADQGRSDNPGRYRDGELLVRFKPSVTESAKLIKHKRAGAQMMREHKALRLQHLRLKKGMTVAEAVASYQGDPDVEYAEPNYLVLQQDIPNDPQYGQQWGLDKIHAPNAWTLTTGSDEAVVAVIDTGIDHTHPDLAANIWMNQGELNGQPGTDNDANGYVNDLYGFNAINNNGDTRDDNSHGTHVAGTIGAVGNNANGVTGVAWKAKLMACKFLDAGGSGTIEDAIACLQYVKSMKVRGINVVATNNSWGTPSYSRALYDAIREQEDILFVAAAGNDGSTAPFYPASYDLPNIISVAASDDGDYKAPFSNSGKWSVDLFAPGTDILSTLPGGGYGFKSGTSMAAPHVSGVAALLKAQDARRTTSAVRNLILAGGDSFAQLADLTITGKRANAYNSLSCSDAPLLAVRHLPTAPQPGVPQTISAISINCGAAVGPVSVVVSGGGSIQLQDDGVAPDEVAGDGIFTGTWTPSGSAAEVLSFSSPLGTTAVSSPPVTIGNQPSVLSPAMLLPNGVTWGAVGSYFSQTFTASGGAPPFTWTIPNVSLPDGLTLNSETGEISGTATGSGIFTFTMEVRDSVGTRDSRPWSLVFNTGARAGWPRELQLHGQQATESSSPIVADLDGDGKDEILASDGNTLYLFHSDGSTGKIDLPGRVSTPAVADLDGDGRKEIAVSVREYYTSQNSIYAFNSDLTPVAGFPAGAYPTVNNGPGWVSSPVAVDFNNDGHPKLAVVASPNRIDDPNYMKSFLIVVDGQGNMLPGWPKMLGSANTWDAPPAVGDIDRDGRLELVVATADGYVRILREDGSELAQWPFDQNVTDAWGPVLADLDGDGDLEVVVSYSTPASGATRSFDSMGTLLTTFPYTSASSGPVVADLDGDGRPEVLAVSGTFGRDIYAMRRDGTILPGWPVSIDAGFGIPALDCYPIIADVNGDGTQDLLITTLDGYDGSPRVVAYDARGLLLPGFPKNGAPGSGMRSTAAIGDVDGNGKLDLVMKSEIGYLYAWEMAEVAADLPRQWPMFRNDATHSGTLVKSFAISATVTAGTGTITPSSAMVKRGASLTVTITPGSNNFFASLEDNGVPVTPVAGSGNSYLYTLDNVTADHALTVSFLDGNAITAISGGYYHTLALKRDGTVWAWGGNAFGQIGDGSTTTRKTPVQVPGLSAVTAIAAGARSSFALKADGTVWGWGLNSSNQLGDGTTTGRATPVQVFSDAKAIAAGEYHGLAVKRDGTVWAWGYNSHGQVGDGTTTSRATPVQVPGLTGVDAVAAGSIHSMARSADGTLWSWGNNGYGQLGDGTGTTRKSPVPVPGLSGVSAIAAGMYHSEILKGDGTIWVWGSNETGQIGDGSTTSRRSPLPVAGLSGMTGLAAAGNRSMALKGDGTVWAWGSFYVGDGSTLSRTAPVQVAELSNVSAVAAGGYCSFALMGDNTLWAWGDNGDGQLGDGTSTGKKTRTLVSGIGTALTPVSSVSGAPVNFTNATTQSLTVGGSGVVSYRFKLDGGEYSSEVPVATPIQVANLAEGVHLVAVLGKDGSGKWQPTATTASWTVDLTPPTATVSGAPAPLTNATTATLTVGGYDVPYYKYQFDGGSYSAETASYTKITLSALAQGQHTLSVIGRDIAGNWQQIPTVVSWTVDTTPPTATLSGTPQSPSRLKSASFSVGGTDVVSYYYKLDSGSSSVEWPVATALNLTSLAEGSHTLSVYGKDAAGNWQPTPTTATWLVDSVAPTTSVSPAGGSYSAVQNVSLYCSDGTGTGCGATFYCLGTNCTPSTPYTGAIAVTASADLRFYSRDAAGNSETTKSASYLLVASAPVLTGSSAVSSWGFVASWRPGALATGYRIDVATDSSFTNFVPGYNNLDVGDVRSEQVTFLNPGTRYYYRVRSYNATTVSVPTASKTVVTLPATPTATASSSATPSAFTARWNPAGGATAYLLDVALDGSFTNFVPGYRSLNVGNVTSYTVSSGIAPGTTYYYRVRAQNGSGLDSGFNGTGIAIHNNAAGGNSDDRGNSLAIDANNKIVVGGNSCKQSSSGCYNTDMALWRYNTDGTLDTSFNGVGYVHGATTITNQHCFGNAVAIDAGGKITLVGSSTYLDNSYGSYVYMPGMTAWRYNANGTRDTTFNSSGYAVETSRDGTGYAAAVDANGKLVAAGTAGQDMVLRRYTATGTKDVSFNGVGYLYSTSAAGSSLGSASAIDSNGKLLVAGEVPGLAKDYDMAIWRYNPDGTLDSSFNFPKGVVTRDGAAGVSNSHDSAGAITLDASGRIVAAGGSKDAAGKINLAIWRLNQDGSFDTTFNGTGSVVYGNTAGGNGDDWAEAIAIDANGRIVVTGSSINAAGKKVMMIWRLNDDGSPDTSFNGTGYLTHNGTVGGTGEATGKSVTIDGNGMVVVTGFSRNENSYNGDDMVIWRYLPGWTSFVSNAVAVTTVPAAPEGVSAASAGRDGFTVSWSGSQSAAGYRMDVATDSGFASMVSAYNNADLGNVTSISLSGLAPGTTYYCRVRAYNASGTGAPSSTATATTLAFDYAVTVVVTGTGGGTVTSTPAGVSSSTTASARFPGGSAVTLHASAAPFSIFTGWSGACSGTGECSFAMTADRSTTANFERDAAHSTFVTGLGAYRPSIQAALDASGDSDIIRLWGIEFAEEIVVGRSVTLSGGYNESYSAQDGSTILRGSVRITTGKLAVERLRLQ